jgi:hypothetical protein
MSVILSWRSVAVVEKSLPPELAKLLQQDQENGPTAADGLRLVRAFLAIEEPQIREAVLVLLEGLAQKGD